MARGLVGWQVPSWSHTGHPSARLQTLLVNLVRSSIAKVLSEPAEEVQNGPGTSSGGGTMGADPAVSAQATLVAQQLYYRVLQHILQTRHPVTVLVEGRFKRTVVPHMEVGRRCRMGCWSTRT